MSEPSNGFIDIPLPLSRAEKKDMQTYRRAYRKAFKHSRELQAQIATMESIAKTTRLSLRHRQHNLSHLRCLASTAFGMLLDADAAAK